MEEGILYRWPVESDGGPSTIAISGNFLVVETPSSFGGEKIPLFDVLNILQISNVTIGSSTTTSRAAGGSKTTFLSSGSPSEAQALVSHPNSQSVGKLVKAAPRKMLMSSGSSGSSDRRVTIFFTLPISKQSKTLSFQTFRAPELHSMLSDALANITEQSHLEKLSTVAGVRIVDVGAIPGALLQLSLWNLCSHNAYLRKSAYSLLHSLKLSYSLQFSIPTRFSDSIIISYTSTNFVEKISMDISCNHPEYVIDFVNASVNALLSPNLSMSEKYTCVLLLKPWIAILSAFFESAPPKIQYNQSEWEDKIAQTTESCLESLSEVSIRDESMILLLGHHIWPLFGRNGKLMDFSLNFFYERYLLDCHHNLLYSPCHTYRMCEEYSSSSYSPEIAILSKSNMDPFVNSAFSNTRQEFLKTGLRAMKPSANVASKIDVSFDDTLSAQPSTGPGCTSNVQASAAQLNIGIRQAIESSNPVKCSQIERRDFFSFRMNSLNEAFTSISRETQVNRRK